MSQQRPAPRDLDLVVPLGFRDRVDKFLVAELPEISRSYAQRLVAAGQVLLRDRRARKGETVVAGDRIRVLGFLLPHERQVKANPELPVQVLHEDDAVVVVDKPPGLPTHPNRYEDDRTLVSFMLARYPEIRGVGDDPLRPGIAHRLDTDTSGLLVCARTDAAYRHLRGQFDAREVQKEYLALVIGEPADDEGRVAMPVGHHPNDPRRMVVVTSDRVRTRGAPREATTLWRVERRFVDLTLLQIRTLTGRMHQVRVHLAGVGMPLAGDARYGRRRGAGLDLARHFLHASRLAFAHPSTGRKVLLASALPDDLCRALETLRPA